MIIYGAHYVSGLELGSGDKAVTTVRMASAPQLWGRGDEGLQTRREYRAAWTGVFERRHRLLQEYTVGAPDSHGGVGVGKVSQRTRKKKNHNVFQLSSQRANGWWHCHLGARGSIRKSLGSEGWDSSAKTGCVLRPFTTSLSCFLVTRPQFTEFLTYEETDAQVLCKRQSKFASSSFCLVAPTSSLRSWADTTWDHQFFPQVQLDCG